jgi:macrolide transport system ATP-binding/permease protein
MLSDLLFRLRSLFRGSVVENELDDELQFHIEEQVEKLVRAGLTREEAARQTRVRFGGLAQVKEDCRKSRGLSLLETTAQDIRFAFRQLGKSPAFTITVVATMALGIGANAAIFTLVNAVLLKNLPVAEPKTLVRIGDQDQCCVRGSAIADGDYGIFSTRTYEELKKDNPEFEDLAAMQAGFEYRPIIVRRDGNQDLPQSVAGEFVSGNYFSTFGLKPAAGRLLADTDDVAGAADTAVMSYETWKIDYNSDPTVVGSTFRVNTRPVTVVGVAPQDFYGDRLVTKPPNFYLAIQAMPALLGASYVHDPDTAWLYVVGRIRPGVAWRPLQEKIGVQLKQMFATSKVFSSAHDRPLLDKVHVVLTPGGGGIQNLQQTYFDRLRLLMWIAGLVLLIACANVANLLLVRGKGRKTEMSVRTALGAARTRIVRQLLTESIGLAVLSGIAALAVSYAGARMLLALAFSGEQHMPIHASPSWEVLAFALGVSVVTGVLFGVAPAWISAQAEPADALRSGTRSTAAGGWWLQRSLVVLQAALSLVLLVGAGLFAKSLNNLQGTDMKLDAINRYIVHVNPQAAGYKVAQLEALARTIEQRFHAVPGMIKVGLSTYTPMEADNEDFGVQIQGRPWLNKGASFVKANGEYFDAVGTRVVMGRGIDVRDTSTAPMIGVVNEAFVKTFFKPGESPIGHHFGPPGPNSPGDWEIVGVVEDTAYTSVRWKDHAMYFTPLTQSPPSRSTQVDPNSDVYIGAIVLATGRPMLDMEAIARRTLAGINPNLSVVKFQTFDAQIGDRFTTERMLSRLMTLFGALALLLATVGLYGVTSYSVARRTAEIGIRMALGAERRGVVGMVMRGAIYQAALGLAIGIPVAMACVRLVKTQLYEITSVNAVVMAGAIIVLVAAACIAAIVPAQRAASIDPVQALRME